MNFVVALLLQIMQDEQDAFWTLVFLMYERNWREIYQAASCKVALLMRDFENYLH